MRLSTLYPSLSTEQRADLAAKAGTDAGYLWQLSTRWRGKRPSLSFLSKLAAADARLTLVDMVEEFSNAPAQTEGEPERKAA